MNQSISQQEEWARFTAFFELIKDVDLSESILSLDTYKIKNASRMIECLKDAHPKLSLVLNDVSGVLDDELMDLLTSRQCENVGYVYNFTFIPNRNEVLNHMQFINEEGDIIKKCFASFKFVANEFYKNKISADLYLDPGFGFSKTFLQNLKMISEFDLLTSELYLHKIHHPLIIGLSKKSFMKRLLNVDTGEETEVFHRQTILNMSRISHSQLIFRVHNPKILDT
jgi:dihydropteroate synthase